MPIGLDASGFHLRPAPNEPWREVVTAIAERTDPRTVVLVERASVHLPTLTRRHAYIFPRQWELHPGYGLKSIEVAIFDRGYDHETIARREAVRDDLFRGNHASRRRALEAITSLGRPVVVVVEPRRHRGLRDVLEAAGFSLLAVTPEREVLYRGTIG